jgi:hypothetical protein
LFYTEATVMTLKIDPILEKYLKSFWLSIGMLILIANAWASGAVLPRGMGIGTPESLATAEQTRADLTFIRLGLGDTGIDDRTKERLAKLLTDSESAVAEIVKSKLAAPADAKKLDQKAVALRDKFDRDIAGILNDGQITDWTQHITIDFIQELIPIGREVLPLSTKDGGPGLNLTDKQLADLLAEEDKKSAAMQEVMDATDATREQKRDAAVEVTFKARQKLREVLTNEQKKKYDDWTLDQIKKMQADQNPTTQP